MKPAQLNLKKHIILPNSYELREPQLLYNLLYILDLPPIYGRICGLCFTILFPNTYLAASFLFDPIYMSSTGRCENCGSHADCPCNQKRFQKNGFDCVCALYIYLSCQLLKLNSAFHHCNLKESVMFLWKQRRAQHAFFGIVPFSGPGGQNPRLLECGAAGGRCPPPPALKQCLLALKLSGVTARILIRRPQSDT